MLPPEGPILAIDIGEIRSGVACSDPSQVVAHPIGTLTRRRGKRFPMQALRVYVEANTPVGIVVGLPLSSDGTERDAAAKARSVGALVQEKTGLPVEFWDERMTTARVHATKKEVGHGRRLRDMDVDALAATVMLQTFLDSRRA